MRCLLIWPAITTISKFVGIEYIVLHCQEPILYVIRKQERHSETQAKQIADYYIIAGVVYQAPDLSSLINSRLLSCLHNLQSAFEESYSYSRYHPSKGYWLEFGKDGEKDSNKERNDKTSKDRAKEDMSGSTLFQRKRVDILLQSLTKKFPPKLIQPVVHQQQSTQPQQHGDKNGTSGAVEDIEQKVEIKVEKSDQNLVPTAPAVNSASFRSSGGPPEKKQRINWALNSILWL